MWEQIKKAWSRLVDFHNTRLVANVSSHTQEDFDLNFNSKFDAAKRLSDFIGMVVRIAFAEFATFYFLHKASQETSWLSLVYGICAVSALLVTIRFASLIITIMFLWETREVKKFHSTIGRWVIFGTGVLFTVCYAVGTIKMVGDLARTSALSSAP